MGKRARVVAIALLLCLVSVAGFALPDLVMDKITIEPLHPHAGEHVFIEVTVANNGGDDVEKPFFVHFFMDGREIAIQSIVGGISSGRSKRVAIEWLALAGLHSLSVEVDPPISRIDESNDSNNHGERNLTVALNPETAAAIGSLKIVVAPFTDFTGTGFLRVGEGVSDKLADRFMGMGIRVLDRSELQSIMQERELNPFLTSDMALAAQLLGADILITGSVTELEVRDSSLQLGILSISSAEVNIRLAANLVNVSTSQVMSLVPAEGYAEGATGFSLDLTGLFGMLNSNSADLCGGGLQTARSWYNVGESIAIAYSNPGIAEWFSIEITTSVGSFVQWLGWQYASTNDCSVWNWDQLDSSGSQMSPGVYTAKIWDGIAYTAEVSFQIRPGISLAILPATEITVGTEQFEDTTVGNALNGAVDDLAIGLLSALESASPILSEQEQAFGSAQSPMAPMREGQVATILPDGRVAINIGASIGVSEGELFEVLSVANVVVDPQTHEILDYEILGVKGEIVITEVRDRVSYGARTSDFEPTIGDIVRWLAR
jgi:curli biogenesis system outer membrane secretion channel CsgG